MSMDEAVKQDPESAVTTCQPPEVEAESGDTRSSPPTSKLSSNRFKDSNKSAESPRAEMKMEEDIVVDEKPNIVFPAMPTLSSPLKRSAPYAVSPTTSKKSSDEAEDDEDDDEEEKLYSTGNDIDPERLKAFNMFCRLFVDENLDRLVPISKQPKDKVQAILDACDRQFPEFHDRARKRIRTYLKSCRRMRRAREMNGWENFRPTPPHLTSPVAESLLSQACENESQNAKRVRMGLEPLSTAQPPKPATNNATNSAPSASSKNPLGAASVCTSGMPSLIPSSLAQSPSQSAHRVVPDWRFQHAPQFRPDLTPFFSNGFLRTPFPGFPSPVPSAAALQASQVVNQLALQQSQVAELNNLKKTTSTPRSGGTSTPSKSSLSASEVSSIRQLISGYRESATFLYRSADELELLISQTN